MSSDDYAGAWDALSSAIGSYKGESSGSIGDLGHLPPEHQFKVIEIAALLSIAQELSALNPNNTTTRAADGTARNGWGFPIHD